MAKRVIINPVTRISGFMELDVTIENNVVTEAFTRGNFFRGFEQMMVGRNPFDAVFLTQRICGICSAAHSVASSLALEDALKVQVKEQGRYQRDIVHGCEFLQNHIRHFYQYTIPDFVKFPEELHLFTTDHKDFRLPKEKNDAIVKSYFDSLEMSRLAHQMLSALGGKAPHNHGVFIGGITTPATTDKIIAMISINNKISQFISEKMIPDVYTIAEYYPEYFSMGKGPGNLLSYGVFHQYKELGTLYVEPSVYTDDGKFSAFHPHLITENIDSAYYSGKSLYQPQETIVESNMEKEKAYTWVKAPRYNGLPFEVGPLARLWLSGKYRKGISALDRTIARVLEAKRLTEIIKILLENVEPGVFLQEKWTIPDSAEGKGLTDTTRGALGHWMKIKDGMFSFYQIITPSTWDFSPRDDRMRGTAEQALVGTIIKDPEHPIELGRIIRSFDPCMSCATHVYRPGKDTMTIKVFG